MRLWLIIAITACCWTGWAQETQTEKERVQRVLRETVQEKEAREGSRRAALTNQTFRTDPRFAEMEARYLDGKITAKQFRKYLQEYQPFLQPAPLVTNTPALNQALELLRKHDPNAPTPAPIPVQPVAADPAAAGSNAPPPADLDDVETKMNNLMLSKQQREKAKELGIEQLDLISPKSGLPRRERLDLLLKLYIEEVITQPEYQAHREKILSEPDPQPPPK